MKLKDFGKNAFIYGIGNVAIKASSFLLVPIYTHSLTLADYGRLETLNITIQVLLVFMGLEIRNSIVRFYAEEQKKNGLATLIGSSLLILIPAVLISSLLFLLLLGPHFNKLLVMDVGSTILILSCISAALECLLMYSITFLRAQNRAMQYVSFSIANAVLVVGFSILFMSLMRFGITGALAARICSCGIITLFLFLKVIPFRSLRVSTTATRQIISFSFPLVFSASGWFVINMSDRYFLGHFSGMSEVGIYSLGFKLTFILLFLVIMPFELTYGPFVFANMEAENVKHNMFRLLKYLMVSLVIVSYGIIMFSVDIIRLIAPAQYEGAHIITMLILFSTALTGIYYWGAAQLHITKKTYFIGISIAVAALLKIVLNFLLIPKYGSWGAACATNISFACATGMLLIAGQHFFHIEMRLRPFVVVGGLIAACAAIYFFTSNLPRIAYYSINCTCFVALPLVLYYAGYFDGAEKGFIRANLSKYLGIRIT